MSFAVLSIKLGYSGFDTTRFRFFFYFLLLAHFSSSFLFLWHYCIILTVQILHYWRPKEGSIEHIKVLKGIDYGINDFDTPFSKIIIDFFYSFLSM